MKIEFDVWSGLGVAVVLSIFVAIPITYLGGWHHIAPVKEVDLSAWFQAVGSVGAICVAIYLGRRTERTQTQGALSLSYVFRSSLLDAFDKIVEGCFLFNKTEVDEGLAVLNDALNLGQSIRLEALPDLDMLKVARLRTIAIKGVSASRQLVESPMEGFSVYKNVREKMRELQAEVIAIDSGGIN